MSYREWKAVYIDKSIPTIKTNNYEDIAIVRTEKDFLKFANEVKPEIERYSGRESKWSGKILLAGENDKSGGKLWNCDIRLNSDAPWHVLIHELIHSCSVSHYGVATYVTHRWEEELTVHYLSQELAALKKFPIVDSGYDSGVELIRVFRAASGIDKPDLEFASELLKQPLGERWDWLGGLITADTIEQYQQLLDKLEAIRQWRIL